MNKVSNLIYIGLLLIGLGLVFIYENKKTYKEKEIDIVEKEVPEEKHEEPKKEEPKKEEPKKEEPKKEEPKKEELKKEEPKKEEPKKEVIDLTAIELVAKDRVLDIGVGDSHEFKILYAPFNATNRDVKLSSSDSSIVKVEGNKIYALKKGTVTITGTSYNNKKSFVTVNVRDDYVSVSSVLLDKSTLILYEGESYSFKTIVVPSNASNKTLTYSSSNTNIAKMENNKVIALKEGTSLIKVVSNNGKSSTCNLIVKNKTDNIIEVDSINIDKTSLTLYVGDSYSFNTTIKPSNASNKTLTYSSSNTNIATITNNTVKALKEGNCVITVRSNNGKTSNCTLVVKAKNVDVSSISLNTTSKTVYLNNSNKSYSISATISPSNATNKNIEWISSNPDIASVDNNGLVTAKNIGSATITAKIGNVSATSTINVKQKVIIEIGASQSYRFVKYKVFNYKRGNNNYTYNSNNPYSGTLVHIHKSGAEQPWQYSTNQDGYKLTLQTLNNYSLKKSFVEFYVYYLLTGNSIGDYSCDQIKKDSSTYIKDLNGYNSATNNFKNLGYNVKTTIVSMHPVKPGSNTSSSVVSNTSSDYCKANKRSNWKYNLYNNKVKESINTKYNNLTYLDTFNLIMDTTKSSSTNRKYSYKLAYSTEGDGIHWDNATANMYLKLMLDNSNNNL